MSAKHVQTVNVGIKLLAFHQLSWRERFFSFGFSGQFLENWSRKSTSDQQSNCQKINSLMSRFTRRGHLVVPTDAGRFPTIIISLRSVSASLVLGLHARYRERSKVGPPPTLPFDFPAKLVRMRDLAHAVGKQDRLLAERWHPIFQFRLGCVLLISA
jgi:hypothetical protein